jgi:hypothetical protein
MCPWNPLPLVEGYESAGQAPSGAVLARKSRTTLKRRLTLEGDGPTVPKLAVSAAGARTQEAE